MKSRKSIGQLIKLVNIEFLELIESTMPLIKAHIEVNKVHRDLFDVFLRELILKQFNLIIITIFVFYDIRCEHVLVLSYQLENQLSGFIYKTTALLALQFLGVLEESGSCIEWGQNNHWLRVLAEVWALHAHFYQKKCYLFEVFY